MQSSRIPWLDTAEAGLEAFAQETVHLGDLSSEG